VGLLNTNVFSLVIHPQNINIIYVGTGEGIFRSGDKGNNWAPIENALRAETVSDLVIHPNNPDVMYALTQSGVYRSADGGNSWIAINTGLEDVSARSIMINPGNPDVLYAGTNAGIFAFRYGSSVKGLIGSVKNIPQAGLTVPPPSPITIGFDIPFNRGRTSAPLLVDLMPRTIVKLHNPTLREGELIRVDLNVREAVLVADEISEVELVSFVGQAKTVPSGQINLPITEEVLVTVDTDGLGEILIKLTPQTMVRGSTHTLTTGDNVEIATVIMDAEIVAISVLIE